MYHRVRLLTLQVTSEFINPAQQIVYELARSSPLFFSGQVEETLHRFPEIAPYVEYIGVFRSGGTFPESAWYRSSPPIVVPDSLKQICMRRTLEAGRMVFLVAAVDGTPLLLAGLPLAGQRIYLTAFDFGAYFEKQVLPFQEDEEVFLFFFGADGKSAVWPTGKNLPVKVEEIHTKVVSDSLIWGFRKARLVELEDAGSWLVAAFQITDPVPAKVVGLRSARSSLEPFFPLWFNFVALVLFGMLLSLLGTTYYWKKIAGPLEKFARGATEIARGDFDQKIEIDSDDEIGRLAKIFNYMVIELRRLNNMNLNRIITEQAKTRTILRNIADGVIVIDPEGQIVAINSSIERWFGVRERDVMEQLLRDVEAFAPLADLVDEIRETRLEGTFTREISVQLPGERNPRVFQARATKIIGQEERSVGVIMVLRDITREKEIDRMKTELVSVVAHELKSPLTSISGFAEILQSMELSRQEVREYASIIYDESNRLADLINKFLDLSKIESGRMDFHPGELRVRDVIDGMLYLVSPQADKKKIRLSVDVLNGNATIWADEKMISQVILNLLSNAIKYSPENTEVKVRVREDGDFVQIEVADQGFGIPREHLDRIFEKFYRIKDDPRHSEERGTGLGLALVKEIVDLHKGRIEVTSEVGKGSTFTIFIPKPKPSGGWHL